MNVVLAVFQVLGIIGVLFFCFLLFMGYCMATAMEDPFGGDQ